MHFEKSNQALMRFDEVSKSLIQSLSEFKSFTRVLNSFNIVFMSQNKA